MGSNITPVCLMGILNITPDSFSDGGMYVSDDSVLGRTRQLLDEGADILDIGAESTGPGATPLSETEELNRLKIFFHGSAGRHATSIALSLDTYKASVAAWGIEHGDVKYINDVSALRADPEMAAVVSGSSASVVLMYSKDGPLPHVTQSPKQYSSLMDTLSAFFDERISFAVTHGISESRIVLDPGFGGFLSLEPMDSWTLVQEFRALRNRFPNSPFLVGVSRKSFIKAKAAGENLDLASKLVEFELWRRGADIIRTHDVGMFKRLYPIAQELME